jgi:hypothetical protein
VGSERGGDRGQVMDGESLRFAAAKLAPSPVVVDDGCARATSERPAGRSG